jgi:hypothetical protein
MLTLEHGTVIHDALLTPLIKKAMGDKVVAGADFGDNYFELDGAKISYHMDLAFQHEGGIGIGEIKGWADYTFNRAMKGEIDHEILCQGWAYHKGTDFNPILFLGFRKETAHMVEICFDKNAPEKIVKTTLTGDLVELAKQDPIMLTEIRSPFDDSVGEYVRERIRWLKLIQSEVPDEIWMKNNVPGKDAVEDEVESVQGNAKCQARAKELGVSLSTVTQNGSWWKIPTGRKILGFPCNYCSHMKRCYPQVKMELKGDRPVWLVERSMTRA